MEMSQKEFVQRYVIKHCGAGFGASDNYLIVKALEVWGKIEAKLGRPITKGNNKDG